MTELGSITDGRPGLAQKKRDYFLSVSYYIFEVIFFYLIYLSYFLLSTQTLLKMYCCSPGAGGEGANTGGRVKKDGGPARAENFN